MTRSELLEVIYWFYPRGLLHDTREYNATKECRRQGRAARRGRAEYPKWEAMLDRLRERYSLLDYTLGLQSGADFPAFSCVIESPGLPLDFHVSLLGPYYGIHRTGAPGEEPAVLDLTREIEATYPGYQPIPPELGDEVLPDLTLITSYFGDATIYLCLLSDTWGRSSPRRRKPSSLPLGPPLPANVVQVLVGVTRIHLGVSVRETGRIIPFRSVRAVRQQGRAEWTSLADPSGSDPPDLAHLLLVPRRMKRRA
jgi:hypothetical protein